MHFVTVDDIQILTTRRVAFTISIERHRHLTDPGVVERSMNAFMTAYTRVEKWEASASGGTLYIVVTGDFDMDVAHEWIRKVRNG